MDESKSHSPTQDSWSIGATDIFKSQDTLIVLNKVDLVALEEGGVPKSFDAEGLHRRCGGAEVCVMSCKTGEGVELFMKCLEKKLKIM